MRRSVLISGASIAGPTLAFWLNRYGFKTVIVERAPALRTGGQNVDIRGAGRRVIELMGLEEAVRAAGTGEQGVRFVHADDRTVAAFPVDRGASGGDSFTAELEILRGDLAQLLYEQTAESTKAESTKYMFGDRITSLRQDGQRITADFERGTPRDVDLVVAADGLRSSTRRMMFGGAVKIRSLGMYTSYLTIPAGPSDTRWARWYNAPGGRSITLRPDNVGTTRATLSFRSDPKGYERLEVGEQKDILRTVFRGAGWEAQRVLDALETSTDFYFESIGQVRAPAWSDRRFAILGDAAYCASPVSGMGTTLALVGAYVLAGELATRIDHQEAFEAYDAVMRPFVTRAQKLPPGVPRIANPRTAAGIAAFNAALKVASSSPVGRLTELFSSDGADPFELPTYSTSSD